jgi:predicted DNA-binding transcriptional regulator AlpA
MSQRQATDDFLSDSETATKLRVNKKTTARWRTSGEGPPYVRVGPRRILYRQKDLDAWAAARTFVSHAAERAAHIARSNEPSRAERGAYHQP